MTLIELQDAHPYGEYSEKNGCYYTCDDDNEVGYFRQMSDGTFEDEWNWCDLETMSEDEADYVLQVATKIIKRL